MSEFSPLRDPVFLLTWQVHLSVVILFALLGIWAGMTRRPWYIAPTLFLALLWLFVPLEAPEPVVVLLLSVSVLAIACRIARRWLDEPPEESSKSGPACLTSFRPYPRTHSRTNHSFIGSQETTSFFTAGGRTARTTGGDLARQMNIRTTTKTSISFSTLGFRRPF